jgi:hypothetical protein
MVVSLGRDSMDHRAKKVRCDYEKQEFIFHGYSL